MEENDALLELIRSGQTTNAANHAQVIKGQEKIHTRIDGHDTRIGRLERWRAGIVAGLAVIATIFGIIFKIWKLLGW